MATRTDELERWADGLERVNPAMASKIRALLQEMEQARRGGTCSCGTETLPRMVARVQDADGFWHSEESCERPSDVASMRNEAVAILEAIQWRGFGPPFTDACPWCGRWGSDHSDQSGAVIAAGHAPDCRIGALLKAWSGGDRSAPAPSQRGEETRNG